MAADLERALERAMAADLSDTVVETIDLRVRAAIEGAASRDPASRWPRRRVLVGFAFAALLAGVAASPAIREYFDGWVGGSFESIWDRATVIDQVVVDHGYRVTLVRAYADPAGLRLALAAEDLERHPFDEMAIGSAQVVDAEGNDYPPTMAETVPAAQGTDASEGLATYVVPPALAEPGIRHLTATVHAIGVRRDAEPGERIAPEDLWSSVEGTWTFAFDLEFFGALSAEPGVTASAAGIDVTLSRLSVMPSATIGFLEIEGLPAVDWGWDPFLKVEHDGQALDIWRLSPGSVGDSLEFGIQRGFDDLAGTWTVTITEFHRDIPDLNSDITTEEESIEGPWVLEFEGPKPVS